MRVELPVTHMSWAEFWVWSEPLQTLALEVMKALLLGDVDHSWINQCFTLPRLTHCILLLFFHAAPPTLMTPWFWVGSSFIQTTHPLDKNWQSFSLKRSKYTVPVALSWKQIAVQAADPFLSFFFLSVLLLKKVPLQRWAEPEEKSPLYECVRRWICVRLLLWGYRGTSL